MDAQQVANIQHAVVQKIQAGNSKQAVGLLKFLHQRCTPAQTRSNEFAVFVVTAGLQAHLHGDVGVVTLLAQLGHALDFPVTIKQAGAAEAKKMAPLEVLCYSQPHKLQQARFRQLATVSLRASAFEGYPPGTAENLAFVLQEADDAQAHVAHFDAVFAAGAGAGASDSPALLPEFDLGASAAAMGDDRTQHALLHFEEETVGAEPNYFAQLVAVREKWWARLLKASSSPAVDDAGDSSNDGGSSGSSSGASVSLSRPDSDAGGGDGGGSAITNGSAGASLVVPDGGFRDVPRRLSRWNEKIAMKTIFRQRVPGPDRDHHLVPTLFAAYFDDLVSSARAAGSSGEGGDAGGGGGGGSDGSGGAGDGAGGGTSLDAEEDEEKAVVHAAVTEAVTAAFTADPALQKVHVKPSHMCRGLGITAVTRAQAVAAKQQQQPLELSKDLFRRKLSRELAPLALASARRGVVVEPHVEHTSEIRITCVFGRPVAAVSYRPGDASGTHDVMFDAAKSRESTTRRVVAYLAAMDAGLTSAVATAETIRAGGGGDGGGGGGASAAAATAPPPPVADAGKRRDTWSRLCEVASAVAAGTDFLRVDFFLDAATGHFWVNEMDPTYAYITATGFHGYLACDFIGHLWFYVWREKLRRRAAATKRAEVEARVAAALKLRDQQQQQQHHAAPTEPAK